MTVAEKDLIQPEDKLQWVWAHALGDGSHHHDGPQDEWPSDKGPHRVGLPSDVHYVYDESLIHDRRIAWKPPLAHRFSRVAVRVKDVDRINSNPHPYLRIVDKSVVPEHDQLLNSMVRSCLRTRYVRAGEVDARADAYFDAIPDIGNADPVRKRMVKDLLIHAVHRGLDPTRAEAIDQRLNLSGARGG